MYHCLVLPVPINSSVTRGPITVHRQRAVGSGNDTVHPRWEELVNSLAQINRVNLPGGAQSQENLHPFPVCYFQTAKSVYNIIVKILQKNVSIK